MAALQMKTKCIENESTTNVHDKEKQPRTNPVAGFVLINEKLPELIQPWNAENVGGRFRRRVVLPLLLLAPSLLSTLLLLFAFALLLLLARLNFGLLINNNSNQYSDMK